MTNLDRAINKIKSSISKKQVWAVFDVDRTLINTTSWYRACTKPDLLISKENITKFLEINEQTYSSQPTLNEYEFREKTLSLLNKTVTKSFLDTVYVEEESLHQHIKDSYVDKRTLYSAGYFIGSQTSIYTEAIKYMDYLYKRYGDELRVLFLTAGYEPFIEGVVNYILDTTDKKNINYEIFGSSITFSKGQGSIDFLCTGKIKKQVVESMIKKQARVVFLADDDISNDALFDSVSANGGKALRVFHNSNSKNSQSWINFIRHNSSVRLTTQELMHNNTSYGLYKRDFLKESYPEVCKKFDRYINKVGIIVLPRKQYYRAQEKMARHIKSNFDKNRWATIFKELTFKKKSSILLRGSCYYHWLPSYIFIDNHTNYEKWYTQFNHSLEILKIIHKYHLLSYWPKLNTEEQLLILSIFDHYKNGIFSALNTIYNTSIDDPKTISDPLLSHLDAIAIKITDLYYQLVFDKPNQYALTHLIENHNMHELNDVMKKHQENQQGMRELDDPYIISLSVLSLLKQIDTQKKKYDMVIDFPCGGLELGLAFHSIFKILNKGKKPPTVIHCFYSSKKIQRDINLKAKRNTNRWLFHFIPKHYHKKLNNVLKKNGHILLYDNNVTTFGTLAEVKQFFLDTYNIKTEAAVAAVYYSNISKYVLGKKSEPLVYNWQKILNYKPITNYITAFNTWGTSQKGRILEATFFSSKLPLNMHLLLNNQIRTGPLFKVCRVHNSIDLVFSLASGANMIGIHAVYPNIQEYRLSQKQYHPLEIPHDKYFTKLPISQFEIKSIAAMQKYMPEGLKQVLIFENKTSTTILKKTIQTYELKNSGLYIQFQHRTDRKYITSVKTAITQNIISAIGIFQNDFMEYFTMLNSILDSETDFILLDMSKHQPDIVNNNQIYRNGNKMPLLKKIARLINNNRIPILVADDTEIHIMKEYLTIFKENCVKIAGIDMQNNLEIPAYEQRYRMIQDQNERYQVHIRKSHEILTKWHTFVTSDLFNNLLTNS